MRVCVVADSASVRFGGEAILPYHYFRLLRQRGVEAWLVVHDRTRGELEALLPDEKHRMLFTPDTRLHRWLYHLSTLLPRRVAEASIGLLSHLLTQSRQKQIIRRLVREQQITVIHQPTPVSPRLPSLMYGFAAPVVIGPLNGGMDYPAAFRGDESNLSRLSVFLGRRCADLVNRLLPGKRRAAIVLVANARTRDALPGGLKGRILQLVENAVEPHTWQAIPSKSASVTSNYDDADSKPRFLFIGRLVDWKRVDIAIRALALVPDAELTIAGEGIMRSVWENVAESECPGRVRFVGFQSHAECSRLLANSTALVLPSIYECGGAVVLEAMAAGRPVIVTRWGGPADYVDAASGFLIEPTSENEMVQDFASAMKQLLANPALGRTMGDAGRKRVLELFTWPGKIEEIEHIYRQASQVSIHEKPEFSTP